MRGESATHNKPKIVMSDADHERLTGLADALLDRVPAVAEELLSELARAEIVTPAAVPANVVQMGSTVLFRSNDGQERRVQLVFPGDADIAAGKVSIMTPVGTALIGLSPGQAITWKAPDGQRHELTVLAVEQPRAPT
jgi:regulator of nucleoside diphosphate kinase